MIEYGDKEFLLRIHSEGNKASERRNFKLINFNPIAIKIGNMEDAISATSHDKYFVEEETPKFHARNTSKDLKNIKTQEFSDDNQSESNRKKDNTPSKFKKTNTTANQNQNLDDITSKDDHKSAGKVSKEKIKPVSRDTTKRDILKVSKSTANKFAIINKKSLRSKRVSMAEQKLNSELSNEKAYLVSCKEYIKKKKFDKRDYLINKQSIHNNIEKHFYKQISNDIQLAVSTEK